MEYPIPLSNRKLCFFLFPSFSHLHVPRRGPLPSCLCHIKHSFRIGNLPSDKLRFLFFFHFSFVPSRLTSEAWRALCTLTRLHAHGGLCVRSDSSFCRGAESRISPWYLIEDRARIRSFFGAVVVSEGPSGLPERASAHPKSEALQHCCENEHAYQTRFPGPKREVDEWRSSRMGRRISFFSGIPWRRWLQHCVLSTVPPRRRSFPYQVSPATHSVFPLLVVFVSGLTLQPKPSALEYQDSRINVWKRYSITDAYNLTSGTCPPLPACGHSGSLPRLANHRTPLWATTWGRTT